MNSSNLKQFVGDLVGALCIFGILFGGLFVVGVMGT